MSIKTFHTPEGDRILFFLILSILIHMGAVWALTSGGALSYFDRPKAGAGSPITIDVVRLPADKPAGDAPRTIVKLPPIETQKLSKEKKPATHLADRSQSVEQETYPEPSPGVATGRGVAQRPPAPVTPPRNQAKTGAGKVAASGNGGKTSGAAGAALTDGGAGELLAPAMEGEDTYAVGATGTGGAGVHTKGAGETIIVPPRPNLFLTEDRITELTRRYESEPQKGERGKILQLNTSESKYADYVTESLVPPIEFRMSRGLAARKGWLGNLLIDFSVRKDGSLGRIELVRSSGNPALDDDTITSLKLAAPFPPLPEKFEMEEITIHALLAQ